jgi:DNA mismatch repair protein MutL
VAREKYMPNTPRSFSSPDNFTSELLVPLRKVENLDFPPVAQSFNLPFSSDSASATMSDYKFIGQVANSYLILETGNGLKIIDQHAASERVQYEKLRAEWILSSASKQKFLLPERLVLPPQEASRLRQSLGLFIKLGFDIEDFGGDSFVINSVPQLLVGRDYLETLKTILGELDADYINEGNKITDAVEKVLKVMACRSAIKFGDPVSETECAALMQALEKCSNKYTCVHGRPNALEYTFMELERLFKRRN